MVIGTGAEEERAAATTIASAKATDMATVTEMESARATANGKGTLTVMATPTWLRIPNFSSDFWDPHRKRNSDSVFDTEESSRNYFLKFQCLESQKIGIPIWDIRNFGNLFAQELTTSHCC
jgi:hypothetical protein